MLTGQCQKFIFVVFPLVSITFRGLRWAALGCYGLLRADTAYQNCFNFIKNFNDSDIANACRGNARKQNLLMCIGFISVFAQSF